MDFEQRLTQLQDKLLQQMKQMNANVDEMRILIAIDDYCPKALKDGWVLHLPMFGDSECKIDHPCVKHYGRASFRPMSDGSFKAETCQHRPAKRYSDLHYIYRATFDEAVDAAVDALIAMPVEVGEAK